MKYHRLRTVFSLLLCCSLLLMAFAGCGGSTPTENSSAPTSEEAAPADSETGDAAEPVPAAGDDKPYAGTTIKVLVVPHPATEPAKEYIPEFEEATGIKVEVEYLERVALGTKQEMELGMQSGAYDVMHMDVSKAARYERADWCEPLDELIASTDPALTDPDLDMDDFVPSYLDLQRANGKTLGLPFSGEVTILYYRTDLFEQAGIAEPPKTFDEMEAAAAKIKELGVDGVGLRARAGEGMNISFWAGFLWGYDGRFVDDSGYPVLNSPQAIQATQKYADLINNYGPAGGGDFTHYELYTAFQQGTLGMFYDASTLSSNFTNPENSKVVDSWAAAPAPLGPDGKGANMIYSHGLMIPKGCKNKEAAWQFIQWYTGKDLQTKISAKPGGFAAIVRQSVMQNPDYVSVHSENNWAGAVEESLKHTRPDYRMYDNPDWPWIGDTIGKAVQDTIVGTGTAEANMTKLNEDLIAFMKEKGYIE